MRDGSAEKAERGLGERAVIATVVLAVIVAAGDRCSSSSSNSGRGAGIRQRLCGGLLIGSADESVQSGVEGGIHVAVSCKRLAALLI